MYPDDRKMSNETRLYPPKCDPWEALRHAIVVQAIDDLRRVLNNKRPVSFKGDIHPKWMSITEIHNEIKDFLCGEWCGFLIGELDGRALYERVVQQERIKLGRRKGRV